MNRIHRHAPYTHESRWEVQTLREESILMKKNHSNLLREERGMALVSIMMILGALTVLSIGLILFARTEVQIADNYKTHTGALYVAEAGVAEVLARMNLDPGTILKINGKEFDAYIGDDPMNPDPNWRTEVHLAKANKLPKPQGTENIVATIQPSATWLSYGDADVGLSPITVEHKWVDRDRDGVREAGEIVLYDEGRNPPENFESGNPVDVVTASGFFDGSQRTIRAEVTRAPIAAQITAPVLSDGEIDLPASKTVRICGHNHDPNMPPGTVMPDCYAWELCDNRTNCAAAGCLFASLTTGGRIQSHVKKHVTEGLPPEKKPKYLVTHGYPSWSDTSSFNVFYDIHDALGITKAEWDSIAATADWTEQKLEKQVDWEGLWVRQGFEEPFKDKAELKETTGSGLIYVDGEFKMKKSTWVGLIYAEGKVDVGSQSRIVGAIISRAEKENGSKEKMKIGKESSVIYSAQAIAQAINRQRNFKVISWKEL